MLEPSLCQWKCMPAFLSVDLEIRVTFTSESSGMFVWDMSIVPHLDAN